MAHVIVEELSHSFSSRNGPILALNNVSFAADIGEVVTVLGPSGCGKSTLLRCLAGLLMPTSGRIRIGESTPGALRAKKAIGFGFQEPSLMEWRTIEENIALPAEIGPISDFGLDGDKRVENLLSITGLKEFRDRYPRQLSVGMKHRVALARALLLKPELLLLDEPLAGLDLLTRTGLLAEISRVLFEYRSTTVIVTHSVEEALFWGTKILVFSSRPGTIVETFNNVVPLPRTLEYSETLQFQTMAVKCRHLLLKSGMEDSNG